MAGVKSVRKDKVTDEMIVDYVRRWTHRGSRVTTAMVAQQFDYSSPSAVLGRLKRIKNIRQERLESLGNIWKVRDES